jgi:agmatinase
MTHYSTDHAFTGRKLGSAIEPTHSGALSFMRRLYSKDVSGTDAVVWGVPYDCSVTMRPGCRFGPAAIRAASAQFCAGDLQYPMMIDPFEHLAMVDYGDCIIAAIIRSPCPCCAPMRRSMGRSRWCSSIAIRTPGMPNLA